MEGEHRVELFFHCHEACVVRGIAGGFEIARGGEVLRLAWPEHAGAEAGVLRGSLDPLGGWVSHRFDRKQPAATLVWSARLAGRSSLRTWIFRILANQARTRPKREARSVPFSALADPDDAGPTVDPDRFFGADHAFAGHWASPPRSWGTVPEEELLARETRERVQAAIDALPASQRAVISLRDVEGWPSEEVCNVLEISETNQRVLLHRARAKVRQALERYFESE